MKNRVVVLGVLVLVLTTKFGWDLKTSTGNGIGSHGTSGLADINVDGPAGNIGGHWLLQIWSNLTSNIQSIESARSSIEDVDFAAEAADLAKNQILAQSGTAMLVQASAISQNILGLLS